MLNASRGDSPYAPGAAVILAEKFASQLSSTDSRVGRKRVLMAGVLGREGSWVLSPGSKVLSPSPDAGCSATQDFGHWTQALFPPSARAPRLLSKARVFALRTGVRAAGT